MKLSKLHQLYQGPATNSGMRSEVVARVFVWVVWLGMVIAVLYCIAKYGRNIPLAEDWLMVAPLTGNEPNFLAWIWAQNNEHRIVLHHRGKERHRALGVVLFFCVLAVFSVAMGYGRAGLVPTVGLPMRYVLLAVPAFCTAFFAYELYGQPKFRNFIQNGLLIGMCLLIPFNTMLGFQWRDWYVKGMNAVEQDLLAGTSRQVIARRHQEFLVHWWDEAKLAAHMQMLHNARIGPFAEMSEDSTIK